jgi:site-specific DNA-methyltransferase (adenine-specific)
VKEERQLNHLRYITLSSCNKTITVTKEEMEKYTPVTDINSIGNTGVYNVTVEDFFASYNGDTYDLVFADPPYNLTKTFNNLAFTSMHYDDYNHYLDSWMSRIDNVSKETASIYICGDWRSSRSIETIGEKYFQIRNRITWERDKGRGAKYNWKNNSEDIWFFTISDDYTFNVDAVKTKKPVIAPYKDAGVPKDWQEVNGEKFRYTHPSNIWSDITVPFWSMSENTFHPTQKPEKLIAKIILASTNEGDNVLDLFAGSGTVASVCKKLGRNCVSIEADVEYCALIYKRLSLIINNNIQGYDGHFLPRNY